MLEVNAVPGWKGLARTLDVDIARLVLNYSYQAACQSDSPKEHSVVSLEQEQS